MTATASLAKAAVWEKNNWHGESAWISVQDEVCAVVTEARSRLIYFGSADGSRNLLNAPLPLPKIDKANPSPNEGGHRFWLGPQYRWVWPPLVDWEHSPAAQATVMAGVLVLRQPHTDPQYPELVREYTWEGQALRCTVRWKDDGRAYFGLHVLAVDTPFKLRAHLQRTPSAPDGLVAARMVDPAPTLQLPHPSLSVEGDYVVIRSGIKRVKVGFPLQALTIERPGGWTLSVLPGPCSVATPESPDQGYLSQVWVGDSADTIAEIEQLTPCLKGDSSGYCSSSIFVEAHPPGK